MTSAIRKMWRPLLAFALLLACAGSLPAQVKELPVYNEWQGRNSTYNAERPFFLIRDIHDLLRFWEKSGSDEPAPMIDFEKYMLLVWCPGASLFDHVPVRIERLLYKEGNYFVLMDFQRKDTGGYWRRPFMATMLPLVTEGDFFIMRKVVRGAHDIDWKPVYTIWDMIGERKRPFEIASLDKAPAKAEFIAHAPEPAGKKTETMVAAVPQKTEPENPFAETPATSVAATAASSGNSSVSTTPATVPAAAPAAQPAKPAQTGTNAIFPEDDNPFATPAAAATTGSKPVTTAPSTPKIDEDPLFGTEFDITF
ncbi:hypothetical protein MASR1M12_12690 [Erysipelotrichia bacterium]